MYYDVAGNEVEVFAGTYMKINPSNFSAVQNQLNAVIEDSYFNAKQLSTSTVSSGCFSFL